MIFTVGIPYKVGQEVTKEYVFDYFKDKEIVQYDSETEGFDEYTKQILCFQIGDYDNQFVIHGSLIKQFKEFLESKTLLGQNIKFDLKFLYVNKIYPNKVWDTFLAESVIFCGELDRRKSLKALALNRLGVDLDKSVREDIWEKGLSEEVIEYSANDVKYLEPIKESQEADLNERDLNKVLYLENKFVLCLAYIEHCGFKLDKDKWKVKCDKDYKNFVEAKEALDKHLIDNHIYYSISPNLTIFSKEVPLDTQINWGSPKQVTDLFRRLGVDVVDQKEKKDSVGEKHIAKYAKENPLIEKYLHYKGLEKLVGTYGESWFTQINPVTGRLHTQFKQIMDTGRLSSGGKNRQTGEEYINFQNIPSDKETRACFVAEEGNTLLISDYSGQEQVVLANKCLEPALLEFYRKGKGEMHSYVASKIYPEIKEDYETLDIEEFKKKHKDKRQAAKTAGFAINYGGNGSTIARNNNLSVDEGNFVYESYFSAFPKLKDYFKKVQKQALRDGFVLINDVLNRKSYVAGWEGFKKNRDKKFTESYWHDYNYIKVNKPEEFPAMREEASKFFRFRGAIERKALNFPIQGTSAEITKISGIKFFEWIKKENLLGIVLFDNSVHDENDIECPLDIADKTSKALEEAMNSAADIYCKTVKLRAVPEQSQFWKK